MRRNSVLRSLRGARSVRSSRRPVLGARARRGIALFTAMFFVGGIGALALSAIYLTANATLLSKSFEKEDDLRYASEAALAIGKASLNFNPAALPNTSYKAMMSTNTLVSGDVKTIPGITVSLYVGPTGSTSGQFGRFASLVADARDAAGNGFVRRLELTQESFAKYAYWTNSEGAGIAFGNGDQLWGPVWSNDTIHINSSGASFRDEVGTAKNIAGVSYGTFSKGYQINQHPIALPSLASLATLSGLAAAGGLSFTAPTTGNETTVRTRIEFVAANMDTVNLAADSTADNDGFFRIYTATAGSVTWLRGDWPGTSSTLPAWTSVTNCGDFHRTAIGGPLKFFPFSVHGHPAGNTWFDTVTANGMTLGGAGNPANYAAAVIKAHAEGDSVETATQFANLMLTHAGIRCYLGGDPHLVAVARTLAAGAGHYANASDVHKGGEDTTFTPIDQFGAWAQYTATPIGVIQTKRPWDAKNLYPLYRGFNTGTKGVIYVAGTVGVSGVLRGDITLYSPNTVVILDDIRYANDPAIGVCKDILGIIAGVSTVVADNSLNSPQYISVSGSGVVRSLDDTPDLYIHSVIMALTSFTVQNYSSEPHDVIGCQGSHDARGCLFLTGGLIQNTRGAVGTSAGTGYVKRYSYDRCAVVNPPPYFPTTGRFQDNRYYELDPVRFNVAALYHSLTPR